MYEHPNGLSRSRATWASRMQDGRGAVLLAETRKRRNRVTMFPLSPTAPPLVQDVVVPDFSDSPVSGMTTTTSCSLLALATTTNVDGRRRPTPSKRHSSIYYKREDEERDGEGGKASRRISILGRDHPERRYSAPPSLDASRRFSSFSSSSSTLTRESRRRSGHLKPLRLSEQFHLTNPSSPTTGRFKKLIRDIKIWLKRLFLPALLLILATATRRSLQYQQQRDAALKKLTLTSTTTLHDAADPPSPATPYFPYSQQQHENDSDGSVVTLTRQGQAAAVGDNDSEENVSAWTSSTDTMHGPSLCQIHGLTPDDPSFFSNAYIC